MAGRGAVSDYDAAGRVRRLPDGHGPLLLGRARASRVDDRLGRYAARGTIFGSTHPEGAARRNASRVTFRRSNALSSSTPAPRRRNRRDRWPGVHAPRARSSLRGNFRGTSTLRSTAPAPSPARPRRPIRDSGAAVTERRGRRFDDLADLDRVLDSERRDDLAAIVLKPFVGNMELVPAVRRSFYDGILARAAGGRAHDLRRGSLRGCVSASWSAADDAGPRPDLSDSREDDGGGSARRAQRRAPA